MRRGCQLGVYRDALRDHSWDMTQTSLDSTKEQVSNQSLGIQLKSAQDSCDRNGWEVDRVCIEDIDDIAENSRSSAASYKCLSCATRAAADLPSPRAPLDLQSTPHYRNR